MHIVPQLKKKLIGVQPKMTTLDKNKTKLDKTDFERLTRHKHMKAPAQSDWGSKTINMLVHKKTGEIQDIQANIFEDRDDSYVGIFGKFHFSLTSRQFKLSVDEHKELSKSASETLKKSINAYNQDHLK